MDINSQRQKAAALRKMHDRSKILVLPNAWDVASAKIFEAAGFPAVATTSSGVANSLGYPDGEAVPREVMLDVIHRIARSLKIPLTADIEGGYAAETETLQANIRAFIEAGAVGINLEDGMHDGSRQLYPLETAVARVKAARAAGEAVGIPLVVNARTDVYLRAVADSSSRFDQIVTRAKAYLAAGADCAFVPGTADADVIGKLVKAIDGPINVMAVAGTPSASELEKLGVARVSTGGGPARAALTATRRVAEELLKRGTWSSFTSTETISHVEMNQLIATK